MCTRLLEPCDLASPYPLALRFLSLFGSFETNDFWSLYEVYDGLIEELVLSELEKDTLSDLEILRGAGERCDAYGRMYASFVSLRGLQRKEGAGRDG